MAKDRIVDTNALLALNPEFANAFYKGEDWALKHMQRCQSLNAGEPEGFRRPFDGAPRKWCGAACTSEEGCVICTLPENPGVARMNRTWRHERKPSELAREGIITISGEIDHETPEKIKEMLRIAENAGVPEIEVRITSNGGQSEPALEIYDAIVNAKVSRRVGYVDSHAFSAAANILQACDWRVATPHAEFLIHHARFHEVTLPTLRNKMIVDIMVLNAERGERRHNEILARRTRKSVAEIVAVCDRDKKMTSREALDFGLIDEIRT